MLTPPAGLHTATVAEAAAKHWGMQVRRLRFLALGAGSYHWVARTNQGARYFLTVDDLRDKPWLGANPEAAFAGLRAAFDTALALSERALLPFVVAPMSTSAGQTACRVAPQYSLAVFPFVGGRTGHWGDDLIGQDRDTLADLLARLHLATPAVPPHALRRGAELYGRAELETALCDLDRAWSSGPFAEAARRELAAKAALVTGWLASYDDLAARVTASGGSTVVTHGEPHPGNIMREDNRFSLIDWDTVALAPPERDLWMLDDGSPGAMARYSHLTGRSVDSAAISFYRLAWTLTDVAAYTAQLRSAHRRSRDTERALAALRKSLEPEPLTKPGPFRHQRG